MKPCQYNRPIEQVKVAKEAVASVGTDPKKRNIDEQEKAKISAKRETAAPDSNRQQKKSDVLVQKGTVRSSGDKEERENNSANERDDSV